MYGTFKINMLLFIGPLKVSLVHACSSIITTVNIIVFLQHWQYSEYSGQY